MTAFFERPLTGPSALKNLAPTGASSTRAEEHRCQRPHAATLSCCWLLGIAAFLTGCGDGKPGPLKVYPVSGTIKYQGQPTPGAMITFFPKGSEIPENVRPNAIADDAGRFELGTYSDIDGAPEGEYAVAVTWRPLIRSDGGAAPGPNRLPPRYSQPETSNLTVKVDPEDTELQPFELAP